MYIAAYIFYALVQAVLTARYGLEEKDSPVGTVVLMAVLAPIVSVILVGCGFYEGVKWLVTYRPKEKQ